MLDAYSSEQIEVAAAVVVLSLAVGSFLSTLVTRMPIGEPLIFGRSHCDRCGAILKPWQLVPLAGWILQGGRCHSCHQAISPMYPLMELGSLGLCLWAFGTVSMAAFVPTVVFGWLLLALAVMDFRSMLLSNSLLLLLLGLGCVATWLLALDPLDHVLGVLVGAATLYGINATYRWSRGRDGLGLGDVILAGAAGAWLGWQGLPSMLVFASGSALVCLFVHRFFGARIRSDMRVAFGSYICFGTWIVWLYGPITWG